MGGKSQQPYALCKETLSLFFLYTISRVKSEVLTIRSRCQGNVITVAKLYSHSTGVDKLTCVVCSYLTQYLIVVFCMSAAVNLIVKMQKAADRLVFQLSGFYDDYQWSRVCFQSKQVCFGTITSQEDVTETYEGDYAFTENIFFIAFAITRTML